MKWDPKNTPNFSLKEMACSHTGKCEMDGGFMKILQSIRDEYGPMSITSGYRDRTHPIEIKKENPGSHAQGTAVDVAVSNSGDRFRLIRLAIKHGVVGIGINKDFIHLDGGHDHMPRPAIWEY